MARTGVLTLLCDQVGAVGGVERYWETVVPALRDAGFDVTVAARRVHDAGRFGGTALEIPWAADDDAPSPSAGRAVAAYLAEIDPQLVVTAGVFDVDVLRAVCAAGVPWVVRIHDHRAFCPTGDRVFPQFPAICDARMGRACAVNALVHGCVRGPRPSTLTRLARRRTVRDWFASADRALVSSDAMARTAAKNGIVAGRIAITPPPLPDAAFAQPCAPRPQRDTVLFAGRIEPNKGLRSLLRALARCPATQRPRLMVAGSGSDEARARAEAKALGVAVEWLGRLEADALREAIDASSVVAMPSLWPEPFGLSGTEAQARGRPAVAYDVGGISEWIGTAGLAVARGDEASLAHAILLVLRDWRRTLRTPANAPRPTACAHTSRGCARSSTSPPLPRRCRTYERRDRRR